MGNCCGTQSGGNFKGEGRTLGAAPANAPPQTDGARASVPPTKTKISSPQAGRTVGKNPQAPDQSKGPKEAAARAAEERQNAAIQGKGKLGRELDKERNQSHNDALKKSAAQNLAERDVDRQTEALRND